MHSATGKENELKHIMDKKVIISIDNVKCDNNDNGSFLLEWKTRMDGFLFDGSVVEHVDADFVCNTISGNICDCISSGLYFSSLSVEYNFADLKEVICDNFIFSSGIRRMNTML